LRRPRHDGARQRSAGRGPRRQDHGARRLAVQQDVQEPELRTRPAAAPLRPPRDRAGAAGRATLLATAGRGARARGERAMSGMRLRLRWIGLVGLSLASEARAVSLALTPASSVAAVGGSVAIAIEIAGLGNGAPPTLSSFDLDVSFDPSVLSFQSAT